MKINSIILTFTKKYKKKSEFPGFTVYEYARKVDIFVDTITDVDSILSEIANYKISEIVAFIDKKQLKKFISPNREEIIELIKKNKFKDIKLSCFLE
jgi:hypothetical protein